MTGLLYSDVACVTWNNSYWTSYTDRSGEERGKLGEGGEAVNASNSQLENPRYGCRFLEFRKNINNPGLNKDISTKFYVN